jgi:hypothetical protein
MITIDTSHFPCPDDITFDSLEYLFGSAANTGSSSASIPWVEIETGGAIIPEQETGAYEDKLKLLEQQLQQSVRLSQRLCIFVGYMQGLMHEKDEQLKTLPELRYLAGLSVARGLEAERYKEKIQELEAVIYSLSQCPRLRLQGMLRATIDYMSTDEAAISMLNWLGFISLVGILFTLIRGF